MAGIDAYFRKMKDAGASDLHLFAGSYPKLRVHGSLEAILSDAILADETLHALLFEIIDSRQQEHFKERGDLDFAYGVPGVGRFRCNYLKQNSGLGAVFRLIPEKIKSIAELNLPPVLEKIALLQSGLILVTGPTGSGKSTTLAALIDHINAHFQKHILTIEDPIEFVHESKRSLLTQREVGTDTASFAAALHSALHENADVVLIGEMRDLETISLAITLAETGQLVFGTLHTNSAAKSIDRIIDVFPPEQQAQVRVMLADSLRAVVAQQLLRTRDGKGRVAVLEILLGSPALSNVVREGKTQQILSIIQGGRAEGMQSLDAALLELVQKRVITAEEAQSKAQEKRLFS